MYTPSTHAGNAVRRAVAIAGVLGIAALAHWTGVARAYPQYSENRDATNCRECHGDFRANNYISNTDGTNWGNLHNLHRFDMMNGDCDTCHGGSLFPVMTNSSTGGAGLEALACVGCHGRAEDNTAANPEVAAGGSGYGAGLRQHHFTAGVLVCDDCHLDADPANYTPVGEDVAPPYYANPGSGHNIPTDACNADGSEDYAGIAEGLDNDGDDVYDLDDSDCSGTAVTDITPVGAVGPQLFANYPNPFFGSTVIEFDTGGANRAEVRIHDVQGRLVRRFVEPDLVSGRHQVLWDGRDAEGREMPSGLYLYELVAGGTKAQRTMVRIK